MSLACKPGSAVGAAHQRPRGRRFPFLRCALLLFMLAGQGTAQEQTRNIQDASLGYRILRVLLPAHSGAVQAGVSRGSYIIDCGSREGVERGSLFNVRAAGMQMGVVRVDRVWRDSAAVSSVRLAHKLRPEADTPLEPGYYLAPKLVFLAPVYFDQGQSAIESAMHERLRYAARFIQTYPNFPLMLEGHTDNRVEGEEARKLATARAERVRLFLHEVHRLPLAQMHIQTSGQDEPIAVNQTEEGRRQNRRVEIVLVDQRPE